MTDVLDPLRVTLLGVLRAEILKRRPQRLDDVRFE
jgi:hypothetical protein